MQVLNRMVGESLSGMETFELSVNYSQFLLFVNLCSRKSQQVPN